MADEEEKTTQLFALRTTANREDQVMDFITSNAEKMLTDWGFSFVVVHPPKYLEKYDKKQQRLHHFTSSDDSGNTSS